MDLNELWRRTKQGDAVAAGDLYRRLKHVICPRIAAMLCDSPARIHLDATEVFHTAFWCGLRAYSEPTNLVALLWTIAKRRILAEARRPDVSRTGRPGDALKDMPDGSAGSPEQQCEEQERRLRDAEQLQRLQEELGTAVYLSLLHTKNGGSWAEAWQVHAPEERSAEAWRKACTRRMKRWSSGRQARG
jgi:DNA-directed RNA polymerase specialized sigma24 family protein